MDEIPAARDISEPTLSAMLGAVDPSWTLQSATPAERGFCTVYRLDVATDGTTETLYLKSSPDGNPWSIPTEARLQAVLDAHTSIPVPEVLGAVDDHDSFPTPFYLMRALPGSDVDYEHVARFEDDALRRLARQTGDHLAELHSLSPVDRFGHARHDGPELAGERPSGDLDTLTVGDAHDDWPTYLRTRVERELDRHADSRFADLTPELEAWFDAEIDALDGPFDPVLGRNDHGLHNLLVDPERGDVTAVLDWGYTLAVPAAYDVAFATYLYSGAFLAGLPDVRDRRPLVREALLDGYRDAAPEAVDAVAAPEPAYEALAMVRIMNDFEHLTLPDGTETAVMDRIRSDVQALLD
jgi:aminoglycoside phosphotransferase (APT) family kinase protein